MVTLLMVEGEAVVLLVVWEPLEALGQEQQALGVRSPSLTCRESREWHR
jgi:hypothetical protein